MWDEGIENLHFAVHEQARFEAIARQLYRKQLKISNERMPLKSHPALTLKFLTSDDERQAFEELYDGRAHSSLERLERIGESSYLQS